MGVSDDSEEQVVMGGRMVRKSRLPSGSWIKFDELAAGLLEAAPDAVFVVDSLRRIVVVNKRCEHMLGYTRSELLGEPIEKLVPEHLKTAHIAHVQRFAAHPDVRTMGRSQDLHALHQDGSLIPVEVALSPADFGDDRLIIAIMRDVRERRELEDRLRYAGTHDQLTGLYNRAFFEEEAARLARGRSPVGVVVVDVDGLKPVNDSFGHPAGDRLLVRAADALRGAFRSEDVVARVGGDEFYALLPGLNQEQTNSMLPRLQAEINKVNEDRRGPRLSVSMGAALASEGTDLPSAIQQADRLMYATKKRKNRKCRSSSGELAAVTERKG